jgi:hypothetical protein
MLPRGPAACPGKKKNPAEEVVSPPTAGLSEIM